MSRGLVTLLSLCLTCTMVAAAPVPPGPSSTDVEAEARTRFDRAMALHRDGRYGPALAEMEAAVALDPRPRYFYNIALIYEWKGDYLRAKTVMEGFLRRTRDRADQERARAALARYRERSTVARIEARISPPGAQLVIDGVTVGTAPLPAPVEVAPGSKRIRVEKAGFVPYEQVELLVGGQLLHLDAALERMPEGELQLDVRAAGARVAVDGRLVGQAPLSHALRLTPGPHEVRVERPDAHPLLRGVDVPAWHDVALTIDEEELELLPRPSPWPWVAMGGGLAATIVGGGLFIAAGELRGEYEADWDPVQERYRTKSEAGRASTQARISDLETGGTIAISVGALAIVGGLIVWLVEDASAEEPELMLWTSGQGVGTTWRF